ncbi:hypothetical protein [Massilia sp. X63]|uniref:hypothetical protein n=1 Tax=Massilia sp. X63 TaxID=3237285 RepID=UPI0034DD808D
MKNRLLEDIDDSQSGMPALPVRRIQTVPPPQHVDVATPSSLAAPAADPGLRRHAGVWRNRAPAPVPSPGAAPLHRPIPPTRPPASPPGAAAAQASPVFAPPRTEQHIDPELASYSSRQPDWSIPLEQDGPSWTERWGRKLLGWSVGLGAAAAVVATAAWMYRDTQVESTLAVVADHSPPAASAALPAAPPEPAAELPPLKLLPPEQVGAASMAGAPPAPEAPREEALPASQLAGAATAAATIAAAKPADKSADKLAAKPADKPVVRRSPERERRVVAAAEPVKRQRAVAKKPAPARERVVARASPTPARPAPAARPSAPAAAPPPVADSPLEQTLRMCRAAGYHATACLKRGCEATRFGLVCRG